MSLGRATIEDVAASLARSAAIGAAVGAIPAPIVAIAGDVEGVIGSARAIERGARWAFTGSRALRAMSGRAAGDDAIGSRHLVVAGEFLHGPGDRSAAIASITADLVALQADIEHGARSPDDARWAMSDVVPALAAWQDFVAHERASALAPWVTDWSAFTQWQDRVLRLRELARARGIALSSADPVPLPMTVWERGGSGTGSSTDRYMALVKWAIYAALGIIGFASLYAALRSARFAIVTRAVSPI